MKNNLKREHIQNHLDNILSDCPELKKYILNDADARCGKLIALAKVGENGNVSAKTEYLTYPEMNQLLRGYYLKSTNKL